MSAKDTAVFKAYLRITLVSRACSLARAAASMERPFELSIECGQRCENILFI